MNNNYLRKLIFSLSAIHILVLAANAQGIVNSGASIVVQSGTHLIVSGGGYTNASGGTINNDGTVKVDGNWTNNASNTVLTSLNGNGVVELNGSSTQTVGGTNPTTFENLTVSGSGVKQLGVNNNTVKNTLTLDGAIALNGNTLIIDNTSTGAIVQNAPASTKNIRSESNDASGKVQWNVGTSTGAYVFPLGTAANESIPFTFNITSAGTGSGNITVASYPTATNNLPKPPSMPNPASADYLNFEAGGGNGTSATVDRWWQVDANGYSVKPITTMTFTYTDTDLNTSGNTMLVEANLKAQRFNTAATQWSAPDFFGGTNTANTGTNTVTVTNVNDYSPWTLHDGTSGGNSPLPITLLNFTAQCNGNGKVAVEWATASEVNNDYFEIQRSLDGANYTTIAVIDGSGNSNNIKNYSFVDESAASAGSYYRLYQVDFNGDAEVFNPAYTHCVSSVNNTVGLYPNPTSEQVNVSVSLTARDNGTITIYDGVGKLVAGFKNTFDKGMNIIPVNTLALAPGHYFVKIDLQNDQLPVQKLVITR